MCVCTAQTHQTLPPEKLGGRCGIPSEVEKSEVLFPVFFFFTLWLFFFLYPCTHTNLNLFLYYFVFFCFCGDSQVRALLRMAKKSFPLLFFVSSLLVALLGSLRRRVHSRSFSITFRSAVGSSNILSTMVAGICWGKSGVSEGMKLVGYSPFCVCGDG